MTHYPVQYYYIGIFKTNEEPSNMPGLEGFRQVGVKVSSTIPPNRMILEIAVIDQ